MNEENKTPAWKKIINTLNKSIEHDYNKHVSITGDTMKVRNTATKHENKSTKELNDIAEKIIKTNICLRLDPSDVIAIKPVTRDLTLLLSKHPHEYVFYNVTNKEWHIKISYYEKIRNELKKFFNFSDIPKGIIKMLISETEKPNVDFDLNDSIYNKLLPFQLEGVKLGLKKGGKLLLADEMGLGKTYQALAIAYYYQLEWPLLIVSPASLLENWRNSVLNFLGLESTVVRKKEQLGGSINIISYDIASRSSVDLEEIKYKVVILDECHYIKSHAAKRTINLMRILQKCERLILLSGTPALSRPVELYTSLIALNKNLFCNMTEYGYRYCNLRKIGQYFDWKGASNHDELFYFLKKCVMIRRTKDEVLSQLPSKFRRQVVLEVAKEKIVKKEKDVVKKLLKSSADKESKKNNNSNMNTMEKNKIDNYFNMVYEDSCECEGNDLGKQKTQIKNGSDHSLFSVADNNNAENDQNFYTKVIEDSVDEALTIRYQIAAELKIEAVKEYIKNILEKEIKFLIFAHHMTMIDGLEEFLKLNTKYIKIDGRTSSVQRQALVDEFQTNESVRVALLGLTACSTGLTLTAAKAVIFAELYWNPGTLLQAEDRVHRIGQKNTVDIHYLTALGTVDEYVWPNLLRKLNTLEKLGIGHNNLKGMQNISAKQKNIDQFARIKKK
ncbi:SWI/SNF- matrix-associated actin-dependent regulator of chromatin subfamily A-like protein 1 [Conglomerata obtusa]